MGERAGRAELLALGAGGWLLARVPGLRSLPADLADGTSVAVVVPARDEAPNLAKLLASLAGQSLPASELVVVDDASGDATAAVAAAGGATVIPAGPRPEGWTGKAWACAVGVRATAAPVLVFLDADTELAPDALARLVGEHQARGARGLLSVAPEHVVVAAYERLSALCNLVSMMGTGAFTPLGGWGCTVGAFGPCLVCRRADYEMAGGHQSVAGEVAEDLALAARFRRSGLPVRLLGGRGVVAYRMYPGGLGQLVEGWTKNLAAGAGAVRPVTMLLVVAWLAGLLRAPWKAGRALARGRGRMAALGLLGAYGLQVEWMLARTGRWGRGTGLAYPLSLAAFLALFTRSAALRIMGRDVAWKGRAVPSRPAMPARPAHSDRVQAQMPGQVGI